jgi:hypothetical protein
MIPCCYLRLNACTSEEMSLSGKTSIPPVSAMSLTRRGRPGGLRSVPLNDRPSLSFRPLRVGDVVRCTNMVHYDLVEDRFAAVRIARFKVWGAEQKPRAFPGLP